MLRREAVASRLRAELRLWPLELQQFSTEKSSSGAQMGEELETGRTFSELDREVKGRERELRWQQHLVLSPSL